MSDLVLKLKTTPVDKRFPSTNQMNHCWNKYNEWVKCLKVVGDEDNCQPLRQLAQSICLTTDVEAWDEQREEGSFAGVKMD